MKNRVSWAIFALAASLTAFVTPSHAQDAAAGERVFIKCRVCHQVGEEAKSTIAPNLNGIIGRVSGTFPDYKNFSAPMKEKAVTWNEETLTAYLHNPREFIPRNSMMFPGLKKDADIVNVIAYLKQFGPDGKKQ
ncbi:c-type cytochrome [Pseudochelatococcus sp. G4_1912]|uniref:c-type cytochrome n=1 Tax=Pseudochelatococcus sp. G4_1912 TaxID=3114288 RepID=UPI0039C6B8D6